MKTLSVIFAAAAVVLWSGCAGNPAPAPAVPAAPAAGSAKVKMYIHLPTKDGKAVTVEAVGSANADRMAIRNNVMEYLKTQLSTQASKYTEAELNGGKLAEAISAAKDATMKKCQELKIEGVELTVTQVQITSM
jgi:PBP1b-binding outer membrane lipoprotein LpoB